MKHYSQDFMLASCFGVTTGKVVRFFNYGGMVDVLVDRNEKNVITAALDRNSSRCDFTYDDYFKQIWSVCDYIISNMDNSVITTDFLIGFDSSKIHIDRADFYTLNLTLKLAKSNKSETNKITLDTYDSWFLSKLISFVLRTYPRRNHDQHL